jgi:nucleoside-diphosphate-sugar epimerase
VVLPLAAIANPALYVQNPLRIFELDFEANLAIVRLCVKHQKRIVFPSTSEVYGMSADLPYDEETSGLTTGPIHKQRWIYSTCKQLMDRVIYAYGERDGLPYTLFRPFNWFGPRQDDVWKRGPSNRVVTQFIGNILHGDPITLVDGGAQKRCFLYIDDAIEGLARIIENKGGAADKRIFNLGDPEAELSIRQLLEMMLNVVGGFKGYGDARQKVKITEQKGTEFYGAGYQDLPSRVPSIENARKYLGWEPKTGLREALKATVAFCLEQRPR